ncbi:MAG TPA: class I SAM-dependent methyltransferase [Pseudonocardiaceae bacterium]|jgi:SAM-dependent methyltransferase|nr:class I SAM-dependent methyltransferase [Pseudonocardiaceae bacterium]
MRSSQQVFARRPPALVRWEQRRAPVVAEALRRDVPTGGVALDVGCGSGALADELTPYFARVVAVDRSPGRFVGSGPFLVTGDACALPVRSASVNFVCSYGVMHHLDLDETLAEVRRVLVPGGLAVLADFVTERPDTRPQVASHVCAAIRAFPAYRRDDGLRRALALTTFRLSPGWLAHVRRDVFLTPADFVDSYSRCLPGARFGTLGQGMTVTWQRPATTRQTAGTT